MAGLLGPVLVGLGSVAAAGPAAAAGSQFVYQAKDLGAEPAGAGTLPLISPNGGYVVASVGATGRVLYKTGDGSTVDLPPSVSAGSPTPGQFQPNAVNDLGLVAGYGIASVTTKSGQTVNTQVAAEWAHGVITNLGGGSFAYPPKPPAPGATCDVSAADTDNRDGVANPSAAAVLNNTGLAAGASTAICPGITVPPGGMLFSSASGGMMLPTAGYPNFTEVRFPRGINAGGTVVAAGYTGTGTIHDGTVEFSANTNGIPTQILSAPWVPVGPLGAGDNGGTAINDQQDLLVGDATVNPAQYDLFTASNSKLTPISGANLPSPPSSIGPQALSNNDVVVGSAAQPGGNAAFVWNATNGMALLKDVTTNAGAVGIVSLVDAPAIASNGTIAAIGMGTDNKAHVYLLTPGGIIVTNVNPSNGPVKDGPAITLSGVGFGAAGSADTVKFCPRAGGTCLAGTGVQVNSDNNLVVTPPDATTLLPAGQQSVLTDVYVTDTKGNTSQEGNTGYIFEDVAVSAVTPRTAPVDKTTRITVTGSGFYSQGAPAVTAVTFTPIGGGTSLQGSNIQVASDVSLTVDTPDPATIIPAGQNSVTVDIQVTSAGVQSPISPADRFTYGLHLTSVTPNSGSPNGGTAITLTGSGFGSPGDSDTVSFTGNGVLVLATNVKVLSDTTITATTPAEPDAIRSAGNIANIGVAVANGDGSNDVPFTYGLHLTSVTPNSGSPNGGTAITLTGSGFGSPGDSDTVSFTGNGVLVLATNVKVLSDTTITATTPAEPDAIRSAGNIANVGVAVANGDGSNDVPFTYGLHLTSVTPNSGSPNGGTAITLTGSGFGSPGDSDTVSFTGNGVLVLATNVKVLSDTTITATTPAEPDAIRSAGNIANIGVAVANGDGSNDVPFTYGLHLTSVTPNSGSPNGGTAITLTGSGFGSPGDSDTVSFTGNGVLVLATNVKVLSDTTITATTPAEPDAIRSAGNIANIGVAVANGDGSNDVPFTYGPGPGPPPCGLLQNCNGASSSDPNGSAVATSDQPSGAVAATGQGVGALTVGRYGANPVGAPTFRSAGSYFDVKTSTPDTFAVVTIRDCDLGGGTAIDWWNPAANAGKGGWQPASNQTYTAGPPACATVTVGPTTSPNLSQLHGTVFGVAKTQLLFLSLSGGLHYANHGPAISGDIDIHQLGNGTIGSVTGSVKLAGARGGTATVYFDIHRTGGSFDFGTIRIDDPGARLDQTTYLLARDLPNGHDGSTHGTAAGVIRIRHRLETVYLAWGITAAT